MLNALRKLLGMAPLAGRDLHGNKYYEKAMKSGGMLYKYMFPLNVEASKTKRWVKMKGISDPIDYNPDKIPGIMRHI